MILKKHGDPKSLKDQVVGPLRNGHEHGLVMGVTLTTYNPWDDPPSTKWNEMGVSLGIVHPYKCMLFHPILQTGDCGPSW